MPSDQGPWGMSASTRTGPPASESDLLLSIRGLTKQFTGTLALDHVDFDLRAGEVHALVGENGAGKSTLIKVLAGVYPADSGGITVRGRAYQAGQEHRLAFIHQDLGLFAPYSVAENIAIVAGYPRRHGLISWSRTRERGRQILAAMGSTVDPDLRAATLTSAERSMVAIARALALDAEILVMDEPTASLTESDVRRLFDVLATLKSRGIGIVFVSHRLDEVFRIADRVTVLRDGRRILTNDIQDLTSSELVYAIVGREMSDLFGSPPPSSIETLLELRDLTLGPSGPVSLEVHRGEVLGLVGLRGAGQELVGRAIFGDFEGWERTGSVKIGGQICDIRSPSDAMRLGIGFVSSRRAEEGTAGSLTVRENIFPNPVTEGKAPVSILGHGPERVRVQGAIARYDVRPTDPERAVGTLSGGNQQKTILARWLEARSRLLVLEEPTLGVDVGAKSAIYRFLREDLARGSAVLLISSDFEEVAGICHRALVFRHGLPVAEVERKDLSVHRLTELASGIGATNLLGAAE
jgi:ribose transport system ATP-binding protein